MSSRQRRRTLAGVRSSCAASAVVMKGGRMRKGVFFSVFLLLDGAVKVSIDSIDVNWRRDEAVGVLTDIVVVMDVESIMTGCADLPKPSNAISVFSALRRVPPIMVGLWSSLI